MTNQMTPAELRAIREGLGVTSEWLADHVGVRVRAVQRWESGASGIKPGIIEAIELLEAQAAEQVADHVAAFTGRGNPVMAIEDDGGDSWPAGWQRMIAFRVRQQVPGLVIVDIEHHDPGTSAAR